MVTIVGALMTNLDVPSFPIILPKFGIVTTVTLPRTNVEKYNIKLQIFIPGDGMKPTVELDSSLIPERPPENEKRDPDIPPHVKIVQHLGLSPLELKEPGFIKVRVLINDMMIKAGVIRITRKAL